MSEPTKVIVEIEGGCVQSVISCGIEVQVIVVNYDGQESPDPEDESGPFVTTLGDTAELNVWPAILSSAISSDRNRRYVNDIMKRAEQAVQEGAWIKVENER